VSVSTPCFLRGQSIRRIRKRSTLIVGFLINLDDEQCQTVSQVFENRAACYFKDIVPTDKSSSGRTPGGP
jgi:hypothetical protein